MKAIALLLLLPALLSAAQISGGPALPDRPASGRVLDQTGSLSDADKARIQGLSDELETRTGAQLAVAVVTTLDGMDPADYANRLFKAWGVGHQGKDDGALILVCPAERKSRIEVGYGLEGKLPDVVAGRILKDELRPYFQDGKFGDGIVQGARRIEEIVSGQPASGAPPPRPRPRSGTRVGGPPEWFLIPFFAIFIVLGAGAIGCGAGATAGGAGAGPSFLVLWGAIFSGIPFFMAFAAASKIGLLILGGVWLLAAISGYRYGYANPKSFRGSGRGGSGGGWSSGGWSSGGGSSDWGGGGGGSDFGGGSSGGGGSSDSW